MLCCSSEVRLVFVYEAFKDFLSCIQLWKAQTGFTSCCTNLVLKTQENHDHLWYMAVMPTKSHRHHYCTVLFLTCFMFCVTEEHTARQHPTALMSVSLCVLWLQNKCSHGPNVWHRTIDFGEGDQTVSCHKLYALSKWHLLPAVWKMCLQWAIWLLCFTLKGIKNKWHCIKINFKKINMNVKI